MGKLVMCAGKRSERPYILKNSRVTISTIEELCIYIASDVELCEEYLYDAKLAAFISEELGLAERGERLAELIEQKAEIKDLIAVCLCSCNLFDRDEIEELVAVLQKPQEEERGKRKLDRISACFARRDYAKAAQLCGDLLENKEEFLFSEELTGKILHNMGIALLHTEGFYFAAQCFLEAYETSHNRESLMSYLLALYYSGEERAFADAKRRTGIDKAFEKELEAKIAQAEADSETEADFTELTELKRLLSEGKIDEYHSNVNRLIHEFKAQYRENVT